MTKKVAAYRLKQKELKQNCKEKAKIRKQKSRLSKRSKLIPTDSKKFQKHIESLC